MIRISGISVPLAYDEELLMHKAAERLGIEPCRISKIDIADRSIDLSDRQNICYKISLLARISDDENEILWRIKDKKVTRETESLYIVSKSKSLKKRPVVVGCGPAGMFAALVLAQAGACPILLERGMDVESRRQSVQTFWRTGVLDIESNVQFGAGGAGTFSDGKLKIGRKDARKMKILEELAEAGAPPEILYESKPHIGTDRLHEMVKKIVVKIISLGGEVHFGTLVTDIIRRDGQVTGVAYIQNQSTCELYTEHVVLAIGHSARDTFSCLEASGIRMEQKSFAVGVRIEHKQSMINNIQYGNCAEEKRLGAADYRMVVHLKNGRGVYTFCMCPGGNVIAAASEECSLVTNGMSNGKRSGSNANSALLVTVERKDIRSDHPLAGIAFQKKIEMAAFTAGGSHFKAPVQRLGDFLEDRSSASYGSVLPTYRPGTEFARVENYLPAEIADSLRQGIVEMGEWMPGYAFADAILTGAETRSTSPVRIIRGENLQSPGINGLYPCGEGAGYAGGILSAAVDGILCAEQITGGKGYV